VPVVLKGTKHVEHDQVTDMDVGRGRVHPQLHTQLVCTGQPCAKVILDVNLDRALAQPVEKRVAQNATR